MKIWSWRQAIEKAKLPCPTKCVLFVLGNYMNEHGEGCYPTVETLAEGAGLSKRATLEHLHKAKLVGFITIRKHGFKGQKWARNEYSPRYPAGMVFAEGNGGAMDVEAQPEAPQEADKKGGDGESPTSAKGGDGASPAWGEGGDSHDTKVVTEGHSNRPANSSKLASCSNLNDESGEHGEQLSDDALLTEQERKAKAVAVEFYEARAQLFGKSVPQVRQSDISKVAQYLAQPAATPDKLLELMRGKMLVIRDKGQNAPGHLGYFEKAVAEAAAAGFPPPVKRAKKAEDVTPEETARQKLAAYQQIVQRRGKDFRAGFFTDDHYREYEQLVARFGTATGEAVRG